MNREEAIQICKETRHRLWILDERNPIWDKGAVSEAILMAIEALEDRPSEYNTISIENEPYTTEYAKGYNDAKREIALSGEYERAYQRGKADAIEALQTDIVRCGECKHKADNYCYKHSHEVTDSDFCSYGERGEE